MGIALDFVLRSYYDMLLASNNNVSWTLITARYLLMSFKSHLLLTCMMSIYNFMSSILRASYNIATTCYLLLSSVVSIHDYMSCSLGPSSKMSTTNYLLLSSVVSVHNYMSCSLAPCCKMSTADNLLLSSVMSIYNNMSIATSRNLLLMSSTNDLLWPSMVSVNNHMLLASSHLLLMCSRNDLISPMVATTHYLSSMMSSYHNLMVTSTTDYLLISSMDILMLSCILGLTNILRPSDHLTRIAHGMLPSSHSSLLDAHFLATVLLDVPSLPFPDNNFLVVGHHSLINDLFKLYKAKVSSVRPIKKFEKHNDNSLLHE